MKLNELTDNVRRCMPAEELRALGKAGLTAAEAQAEFLARSERELQTAVANLLRLRGIAFHCARMDRRTTGTLGWPDFTFAVKGRAMAFEVKHGKYEMSPAQMECHRLLLENGWDVRVIRGLDEARQVLDDVRGGPGRSQSRDRTEGDDPPSYGRASVRCGDIRSEGSVPGVLDSGGHAGATPGGDARHEWSGTAQQPGPAEDLPKPAGSHLHAPVRRESDLPKSLHAGQAMHAPPLSSPPQRLRQVALLGASREGSAGCESENAKALMSINAARSAIQNADASYPVRRESDLPKSLHAGQAMHTPPLSSAPPGLRQVALPGAPREGVASE